MFATTKEEIQEVLKTFSKKQKIQLRQEFGSRPIQGIRHDVDDGFVVVQFGADRPMVQHSFFIRKNGKIVNKTTKPTYADWSNRWTKA